MQQFFGKTTWRVFLGLALATLIGAVFLRVPETHAILLALIALAGAWSYRKKPELAFVLVFAELFAFSHGKLFETEIAGFIFTSRMALFAGIMCAWGVKRLLGRVRLMVSPALLTPWVFLAAAIVIGLLIGLLNNDLRSVLDDFNAYVYALYLLPLLSVSWTREARRELLQTLVGAALWISVLSLALLYTFTHLPNEVLEVTYKFIRDTRIGEITLMEGGYWRVFIQSQIVLIPTLLLALAFDAEISGSSLNTPPSRKRDTSPRLGEEAKIETRLHTLEPREETAHRPPAIGCDWRQIFRAPSMKISAPIAATDPKTPSCRSLWLLSFVIAGLVISLSRSFWVGLLVALPVLAFLFLRAGFGRELLRRFPSWATSVLLAFALLATMALTVFPVPSRVVDLRETFSSRTSEAGDLAISSRWNLLPVMLEAMREAPMLGTGFGRELAFVSDDPRVRAIYPDGKWRTYKFEWGWLDFWVKMGALGFLAFVLLFLTYDRLLRQSLSQPLWLRVALRATLFALAAAHIFSPYLNHPLGLGLLLFVSAFLDFEDGKAWNFASVVEEKIKVPKLVSPVPTTRTE